MDIRKIITSVENHQELMGYAMQRLNILQSYLTNKILTPSNYDEQYQMAVNKVIKFISHDNYVVEFNAYGKNFIIEIIPVPFSKVIYLRTFEIISNPENYPQMMKSPYYDLDIIINSNNVSAFDSPSEVHQDFERFGYLYTNRFFDLMYGFANKSQ